MYYSDDIQQELLRARKNKILVFTSGSFDLFHKGHFQYLYQAKKLGDLLIVQVDSDKLIGEEKNRFRPIVDEKTRFSIVSSLRFVDYAFISDRSSSSLEQLNMVKPDIFVRVFRPEKGAFFHKLKKTELEKAIRGMKVVYLNPTRGISTSKIISQISCQVFDPKLNKNLASDLLNTAKTYLHLGYSYSGTKIAAAILSDTCRVYVGVNISNASPSLTICAERVALSQFILNGDRQISKVAIVSNSNELPYPCGYCLQALAEFNKKSKDFGIYLENGTGKRTYTTLKKLFPHPYISLRRREYQ